MIVKIAGARTFRYWVCCEPFGQAMQMGTDIEWYGPLIYAEDKRETWNMGQGLPQPSFCPWCGKHNPMRKLD